LIPFAPSHSGSAGPFRRSRVRRSVRVHDGGFADDRAAKYANASEAASKSPMRLSSPFQIFLGGGSKGAKAGTSPAMTLAIAYRVGDPTRANVRRMSCRESRQPRTLLRSASSSAAWSNACVGFDELSPSLNTKQLGRYRSMRIERRRKQAAVLPPLFATSLMPQS